MPMGIHLARLLPEADQILLLEPSALGQIMLQHIKSSTRPNEPLHRGNYFLDCLRHPYPSDLEKKIGSVLAEGWAWLEQQGLIAKAHVGDGSHYIVTRKGAEIQSDQDFLDFQMSSLLPAELLHHVIASKVWATFIRGDYDTAVFQAFKEVEVAVRDACGWPASNENLGVG